MSRHDIYNGVGFFGDLGGLSDHIYPFFLEPGGCILSEIDWRQRMIRRSMGLLLGDSFMRLEGRAWKGKLELGLTTRN